MKYTPPRLQRLGSLAQLTLGCAGSGMDNGAKTKNKPPGKPC